MTAHASMPAAGDIPQDWAERDAIGSYLDAVSEIGKRVKAGEPVPDLFKPRVAK